MLTGNPSHERSKQSWATGLNAFLTTVVAVSTFFVGVAQWRTSERQTEIADALAQLEFAKSEAKFKIEASKDLTPFKTGLTDRQLLLPTSVAITPLEGARELQLIDVPVTIALADPLGDMACTIEVRGLYLEDADNVAKLWEPSTKYLPQLLMHLEAHGLYVFDRKPVARLTFVDLLGRPGVKRYQLSGEEFIGPDESGMPLYSGAWSKGEGFYTDDGMPEKFCPSAANLIKAALKEAGGKAGEESPRERTRQAFKASG
ncbi:MAG: hypothetical protein DI606_16645 [Sphingobium sp.]|uniref:hypothetical protein n=1 Tax=Sphingobium sp. TaxID=1912891 RepID=UPI000DB6255D|nr:hypothetical protein [Sphingobium sp.]PZU07391.1 MAG: hypothetical protein DI606_16645 [Sphingobium sp.]